MLATITIIGLVVGSIIIGLETVLALARDGYETLASMRDIKKRDS